MALPKEYVAGTKVVLKSPLPANLYYFTLEWNETEPFCMKTQTNLHSQPRREDCSSSVKNMKLPKKSLNSFKFDFSDSLSINYDWLLNKYDWELPLEGSLNYC
jgi:hypothetical protein